MGWGSQGPFWLSIIIELNDTASYFTSIRYLSNEFNHVSSPREPVGIILSQDLKIELTNPGTLTSRHPNHLKLENDLYNKPA